MARLDAGHCLIFFSIFRLRESGLVYVGTVQVGPLNLSCGSKTGIQFVMNGLLRSVGKEDIVLSKKWTFHQWVHRPFHRHRLIPYSRQTEWVWPSEHLLKLLSRLFLLIRICTHLSFGCLYNCPWIVAEETLEYAGCNCIVAANFSIRRRCKWVERDRSDTVTAMGGLCLERPVEIGASRPSMRMCVVWV